MSGSIDSPAHKVSSKEVSAFENIQFLISRRQSNECGTGTIKWIHNRTDYRKTTLVRSNTVIFGSFIWSILQTVYILFNSLSNRYLKDFLLLSNKK